MSIALGDAKSSKVLNVFCHAARVFIKDLKDLNVG